MKCDLLEGSTHLIPGFELQLRLEFVEPLELELPCLLTMHNLRLLCVWEIRFVLFFSCVHMPTKMSENPFCLFNMTHDMLDLNKFAKHFMLFPPDSFQFFYTESRSKKFLR